ncbi:glycosyltransferase family 4 protein [Ohtaekwangia koreensis]|uniref:Glycosyltransferase involved in cell wall bisynthesis n=1 Tax=Ohtaekwangia koreensis TaxID=688867 RepID=A0A1T5M3X6_9BACT|nr:glycosyltransferase family 4 protein [Ohtaekwangia koreensis]SKC82961.1 Glycosyltransferase involved in cell wall bisynthesis [Ohtaekwangia koreensis]
MSKKSDSITKNCAIFIMPRSSSDWAGAEALWITVAGWAAAAARALGDAYVLTTDRIAKPDEVIHYPLAARNIKQGRQGQLSRWIPLMLITLIKDLLLWRKSRRKSNYSYPLPFNAEHINFIWEQHDLFPGPGREMANKYKVPLITYVHAPQVWESAKWGVNRFVWGWFLEKFVEAPALKRSDLVACVSQEVADKLEKMGIPKNKILISPMAVDPYLFKKNQDAKSLKESLRLSNKTVIGWTGSFRNFHGLDLLVKAFNQVHQSHPDTSLLLVGDGFEKVNIEKLVEELEITDAVVFAGRQAFAQIPSFVSIFDIAIVSARSSEGFHYSPLKLREYLAAGKATLAPRAGEIPSLFMHGETVMLYTAGEINDMATKLTELISNVEFREEISKRGMEYILSNGTWDFELQKSLLSLTRHDEIH